MRCIRHDHSAWRRLDDDISRPPTGRRVIHPRRGRRGVINRRRRRLIDRRIINRRRRGLIDRRIIGAGCRSRLIDLRLWCRLKDSRWRFSGLHHLSGNALSRIVSSRSAGHGGVGLELLTGLCPCGHGIIPPPIVRADPITSHRTSGRGHEHLHARRWRRLCRSRGWGSALWCDDVRKLWSCGFWCALHATVDLRDVVPAFVAHRRKTHMGEAWIEHVGEVRLALLERLLCRGRVVVHRHVLSNFVDREPCCVHAIRRCSAPLGDMFEHIVLGHFCAVSHGRCVEPSITRKWRGPLRGATRIDGLQHRLFTTRIVILRQHGQGEHGP